MNNLPPALPPLLIDDRAGSKSLVKYPPLDTVGELCRLDSGDVLVTGNGPEGDVLVGVEYKSIFDLISSADTGRLQATQIPRMLDDYDVTWLLYYGTYKPGPRGELQLRKGKTWRTYHLGTRPVPYGYVEAFLLTLAALGVKVKQVYGPEEAAQWLGVLHRWWSKPWNKHRSLHSFDNSREVSLLPDMDDGTVLRARVAAQLPGVGYTRAVAVARHFSSVVDMVCAGAREWEKVEGIGKVVSSAVERAVR